MERSNGMRRNWARVLAIGGSAVLAASVVGAGAVVAQDGTFAAEKPDLKFGYRIAGLNSVAPLLVAEDRGLWQECGLNSVELVLTESVQPGVVSGSLDAGLVETVDAGQAQLDGLPIELVAGYRPYSRNVIAVAPEIESVADLEGRDILLGGTPGTLDFDVRVGLLKEAGYDLEGVNYNPVTIEGFSDAWVAQLEAGNIVMTPIFNRHYQRLADQGFQFWVDRKDFGSDHIVANSDFLANNPESAAALLCGIVGGIQVWADPANMKYILGLGEAFGIEITDRITLAYEEDIKNYDPFDGGWPMDLMVDLYDEIVSPINDGAVVDLDALINLDALHKAQEALGLELNPPDDL
jgi:NitT/TauT family transport system substrate-binding protein